MKLHPHPPSHHGSTTARRRWRVAASALCLALLTPMLVASPAAATGAPAVTTGPTVAVADADRGDAPVRRLRAVLRCRGGVDAGAPEVTCRWRARTAGAAGFVLVRADGDGRSVVYRSDDLGVRTFTDTDVEFDTRYRYRLILVDADGDRIGRSRINPAIVRSQRPEILGLECDGTETDPVEVTCIWDAPTAAGAESVQLWRVLPGSPRALVATVAPDETTATDELPPGVTRARYAVVARNADGVIVARSRAERLG
ncbi:MAG: hypothetical protein ACE367_11800 [Acidimicrobiales bacterium]